MTWIFSKCERIHSTLQGQETSQKDDEVTLFDRQKNVYSCGESFDQLYLRILCTEVDSRSNYVKIDIERVDSRSGSNS